VRGAVNRGRAGAGRNEILAAYFPGLLVSPTPPGAAARKAEPAVAPVIRVMLPESEREHLSATRKLAARIVHELAVRLGVSEPALVELTFHATADAYTRATGQPWWTAGRTSGSTIDLLPRAALVKRGILESTLRHEFTHVLADAPLAGRPLWVREGLAVHLARELAPGDGGPACPPDAVLRSPASADAWRRAYQDAGSCVARALSAGVRWQDLR
jgi:hypothetical protein